MDGAASVLAVVSLAIQLGETAFKIKKFLDTVSNAPLEILRLKDIVFQLHLMIENTTIYLHDSKSFCRDESPFRNSIRNALERCRRSLAPIEKLLPENDISKKGHSASIKRSHWALACKKGQIEQYESELVRAKQALHMALSLDSNTHIISILNVIKSSVQLLPDISQRQQQSRPTEGGTHMNNNLSTINFHPRSTYIYAAIPSYSCLSDASVNITSYVGQELHLRSYKLGGINRNHPRVFEVEIKKSHIAIAQLSVPLFRDSWVPINISVRNRIPENARIIEACRAGDSRAVKELIKLKKIGLNDSTPSNETPLSVAIQGGFEDVVETLLQQGADPNLPCGSFDTSPSQVALVFEKPTILRKLIVHEADLEYNSTRAWSLLHHLFDGYRSTANAEYTSILKNLICFDDIKDPAGWTALHRCAVFGSAADIKFLHDDLGASTCPEQYVTNAGWSAIHLAAMTNNKSTLEALMGFQKAEPGVEQFSQSDASLLNLVDSHGWTLLHLAMLKRSEDTMDWLLRHGADPHCTNYPTVTWPEGYEGKVVEAADLAKDAGEDFLKSFVNSLNSSNYDVTLHGQDIFWPVGC